MTTPFQDRFITSADGLSLYLRYYAGPEDAPPILCIPGLTRNSRDFEAIAPILAEKRRVLAIDMRGRGRSDYADDPATYTPQHYGSDVLAALDQLAVPKVVLIGTSLGGIIGMGLASNVPDRLAALVLNDVGPVIDRAGLQRIGGYVGRKTVMSDWRQAADAFQAGNAAVYPDYGDDDWMVMAKRSFHWDEAAGGLVSSYDKAIADGFKAGLDARDPGDLWPVFDAMPDDLPVLALRGGLSDILSAETLSKMQIQRPGLTAATIPRVGHVPTLTEPDSLAALTGFLRGL